MTIDGWVAGWAERTPDAPALFFQGETLTYADFAARIDARAAALAEAGLRRGGRVAWLGLNHPEVFTLLFACARLGALLVPLNWRLAPAEIEGIVEDCGPVLLVHDDAFADAAAALAREGRAIVHHDAPVIPGLTADLEGESAEAAGTIRDRARDDGGGDRAAAPLLVVYTSGSTGRPKGVVLAQSALIANAAMSVEAHELTAADRALVVLPLFHVGGLNILPTPAFSIGAAVDLHERFDPAAALAALQQATVAIVVPTVLQAMMAEAEWAAADLKRLRVLSIGSTDVPRDLIDAAQARGVPVIQIYGATETAPFAIHQRIADAATTAGSIGRAGRGCEISLRRADGGEARVGEPGEIWVRGPNVLTGYWRDPAETARRLTDGWFHTGDVATRDGDGNYWFADRLKHVIISGGENIYPAELERILRPHPHIADVAVVGRPDRKWGEVPVAVIVPEAGRKPIGAAEILAAFDGALARFKHPKDVIFVDALPRNAMGKVVVADVKRMIGFEG